MSRVCRELQQSRTAIFTLEDPLYADAFIQTLDSWRNGTDGREDGVSGTHVFDGEYTDETDEKLDALDSEGHEGLAVLDLTKGMPDPCVIEYLAKIANQPDGPMILILSSENWTETDILDEEATALDELIEQVEIGAVVARSGYSLRLKMRASPVVATEVARDNSPSAFSDVPLGYTRL